MQYLVLMDGRVVPIPKGTPIPESIKQYVVSVSDQPIPKRDIQSVPYLAPEYGLFSYDERAGFLPEGGARTATNIFENITPGYSDVSQIGSYQERMGGRDILGLPVKETNIERALGIAQSVDPNLPNYVAPLENIFNLDFGGQGLFGMSGPEAFTQFNIGTGDLGRYMEDLAKVGAQAPGAPVAINPLNDAVLKNLSLGRTGNQVMFKDNSPAGTRDTYLTPEEMGERLGLDVAKATSKEQLIKSINKKLREDADANSRYLKTDVLVNQPTTGGEKRQLDTINVEDVSKLYKENIKAQQKEADDIEAAKRVSNIGLGNKIKNIFSDPYDEYVASVPEGETVLSRKAYEIQANELLKKSGMDVKEVAEKASSFSPNDFYNLVGMYYQIGGLLNEEQKPQKLVSMSPTPGLRLEQEDLYKNRRI